VALISDAAKAPQDKMRALLVFAMQGTPFAPPRPSGQR